MMKDYKNTQTMPMNAEIACPTAHIGIDVAALVPGLTVTGVSVGVVAGGVGVFAEVSPSLST